MQQKILHHLHNHTISLNMAIDMTDKAEDEATKLVFLNYGRLLQGKSLIRPPIRSLKIPSEDLRISFFCLSLTNRVHRLALCAKNFGAKIQFITQDKCTDDFLENSTSLSCFDNIVHIANPFTDMADILNAMEKFNTNIMHCHAQCTFTSSLFPFIAAANVPVVIDYYDLNHGTYSFWPIPFFKENRFFEKVCFSNTDGISMRSPFLRMPVVRDIYKTGTPVALLQDPIISSWCKRKTVNGNKIHIAIDGDSNEYETLRRIIDDIVKFSLNNNSIHLHIYRSAGLEGRYNQKNITLYKYIQYDKFSSFLSSMDAFIILDLKEFEIVAGYHPDHHKYSSRCSLVAGLEADLVFIHPKRIEFMYKTSGKARRAIPYTHDDIYKTSFWETLPGKIRQLQNTEPEREWLSDIRTSKRMKAFYQHVIRNAARTRGML